MAKFYPLNKATAHRPQTSKELASQRWCHKEIYSGTCWSCFFFFLNKLSFISKTNFCLDLFLCSSFPHYTESKTTRVMCCMNLKELAGIYLNIIKVMYDTPTREGNGTPLQYSCQENPRDGGAWWAAVFGVAQSRTWLKQLSSSMTRQQLTSYSLMTTKSAVSETRAKQDCAHAGQSGKKKKYKAPRLERKK